VNASVKRPLFSLWLVMIMAVVMFIPNAYVAKAAVGANVAFNKSITVDSVYSTNVASNAIDGVRSDASRWISANTAGPHWAVIDLGTSLTLYSSEIATGSGTSSAVSNFVLQAWDGSDWVNIPGTSVSGNTKTLVAHTFTNPVTTNKVRFFSTDNGHVRVKEIMLFSDNAPPGSTVTFHTTDDAWMWGTSSMGGTTATMNVDSAADKKSYLKFTVSNAGSISAAYVNVLCTTGGTATIGAYAGTGTAWTESNLSWSNAPAVGTLLDSRNIAFTAGKVYSFDVTPLVKGNGTYSIVLKAAAGAQVAFSTKEGTMKPTMVTTAAGPNLTGYTLLRDYSFGTNQSIKNITALSTSFQPYGAAGTAVINQEWQRYKPFNTTNHNFTSRALELTATPNLGGVYSGGISSGQIVTKETFYPSNGKTYVFQLRAKIPKKTGAWPAFWMYSPGGEGSTKSEIDIFEFFDTPTQNTLDWTGYDHGDGVGSNYHSIMTNQWVWRPGFDFSDNYHVYTLVWKEGDIQKWVDNTMVKGTHFTWYGPAPHVLINLAMGGSTNNNPTAASFPAVFSIDYFRVFEKLN
jgi:beta-glucanase (GH16 family)